MAERTDSGTPPASPMAPIEGRPYLTPRTPSPDRRPAAKPPAAPTGLSGASGSGPVLPETPALVCEGGLVAHANQAVAALAGCTPEILQGLPVERLLVGTDPDLDLVRPDGRSVPVRVVRLPLTRPGAQVIHVVDVADLRKAADSLRSERRRVAEAESVSGTGSWEFDPVSEQTWWSPGHYELLGIAPGSVVPGPDAVLGVVHPDDRERIGRLWREQLRSGVPVDVEYRVVLPGGKIRTLMSRARWHRDGMGRLERCIGTLQDVTDARRADLAVRQERSRLAEAQRVARIGTWEWNPSIGLMVWSDVLRELYGIASQVEPTFDRFVTMVHPGDREWVEELWRQAVGDPQPVECEHRVVRSDGATRMFRCYGASTTDSAGNRRLIGTAQDVTEQRSAEARMERSSQRFADLVSVAPVGIGIFDGSDRLIDANDALCRLLGYNLEQLRGMTSAALTHADERDARSRAMAEHRASGAKSYSEPQRKLVRADGTPVYCEMHVSVSVQDDGQRFLLVVFADVTERRRVAEALRYQATHDELTRLPNRAAAKSLLADLLRRDRSRIAVLCCDIDNFKRVNDSLGHDAGDELLVALARRLETGLRDSCTVARLSGDVYVVICSDVRDYGGVGELVGAVRTLLRGAVPVHGQLLRVSAAIGVAVPDGDTTRPEDLLRFADAAMVEAKKQGAGRVAEANPALIATADRQVHLEGELRDALANDSLEVHFQPVVGPDGSVQSAEALVRWPHPERGLITPDKFLPVAEEGGLMGDLDRWVLRTALRHAMKWPAGPNGRPVSVAVNLAGLVPGSPEFVDTVATSVAESGIAWQRVILELVETALMDLPSRARKAMDELVGRGVRFAVDDFGTGYSSLSRLKDLPAQIVKVDRSFVSGVGVDPSDFAVARAVVDLARAMGRYCVAEGVETSTQFHVLRGLGVDAYQGWLFSRPVPARDFPALLALGPLRIPDETSPRLMPPITEPASETSRS